MVIAQWIEDRTGHRPRLPKIRNEHPHTDRSGGGRYIPHQQTIILGHTTEPELRKATLLHELAHWASYALRDDDYFGQHDEGFYEVLEQIHKHFQTPREIAIRVENGCTGEYQCPAHWLA